MAKLNQHVELHLAIHCICIAHVMIAYLRTSEQRHSRAMHLFNAPIFLAIAASRDRLWANDVCCHVIGVKHVNSLPRLRGTNAPFGNLEAWRINTSSSIVWADELNDMSESATKTAAALDIIRL